MGKKPAVSKAKPKGTAPKPVEGEVLDAEKPADGAAEEQGTTRPADEDRENATQATQLGDSDRQNDAGKIADPVATDSAVSQPVDGPIAHARPGETRGMCWERLRKEARSAGMARGQGPGTAYEWATRETDLLFPPEEAEVEAEVLPFPAADASLPTVGILVSPAPAADDQGVSGLSDLPPSWPELPANAQLQVEIAWVTANRLRVRDGTGVNLSKALSPAPSYSALSWLETSILFPAKFADISVKATADQDSEKEFIKREKMAIEEIRSILAEMLEAEG